MLIYSLLFFFVKMGLHFANKMWPKKNLTVSRYWGTYICEQLFFKDEAH